MRTIIECVKDKITTYPYLNLLTYADTDVSYNNGIFPVFRNNTDKVLGQQTLTINKVKLDDIIDSSYYINVNQYKLYTVSDIVNALDKIYDFNDLLLTTIINIIIDNGYIYSNYDVMDDPVSNITIGIKDNLLYTGNLNISLHNLDYRPPELYSFNGAIASTDNKLMFTAIETEFYKNANMPTTLNVSINNQEYVLDKVLTSNVVTYQIASGETLPTGNNITLSFSFDGAITFLGSLYDINTILSIGGKQYRNNTETNISLRLITDGLPNLTTVESIKSIGRCYANSNGRFLVPNTEDIGWGSKCPKLNKFGDNFMDGLTVSYYNKNNLITNGGDSFSGLFYGFTGLTNTGLPTVAINNVDLTPNKHPALNIDYLFKQTALTSIVNIESLFNLVNIDYNISSIVGTYSYIPTLTTIDTATNNYMFDKFVGKEIIQLYYKTGVTHVTKDIFSSMPMIEKIHLFVSNDTTTVTFDEGCLQQLPKLTTLSSFSENATYPEKFFSNLPSVTTIDTCFNKCGITKITANSFSGLTALTSAKNFFMGISVVPTALPKDVFSSWTNVTSLVNFVNGLTNPSFIHKLSFTACTKITDISGFYKNTKNILFKDEYDFPFYTTCPNITNVTELFSASEITFLDLKTFFVNHKSLTTLTKMFYQPSASNKFVMDSSYILAAFQIFTFNKTSSYDLTYMFTNQTGVTGKGMDVINYLLTKISSDKMQHIFAGCTTLTDYATIPDIYK